MFCVIMKRKHKRCMEGETSVELLHIICAIVMSAGGLGCEWSECASSLAHFLTASCQGSAGGLHVPMQTGLCVYMRVGNE